ncbi:MAG TPA: DsbA family protein [Candidatus Udaeobacter sp.]|nr:DsbA family protein [Candidatus Udaeobacter sp.]
MKAPPLGHLGIYRILPGPAHSAAAVGNVGVAVVATPALILYLEQASARGLEGFLEPGEASVGTVVDVEHLVAAVPGRPVVAEARVAGVDGRRVVFAVEARQDEKLIMRGRHERRAILLDRFLQRQGLKRFSRRRLDFWFDFHSPWCYLAASRIGELGRRHNLEVRWRPVHLARLIEAVDGRRPLEENRHFVAWYRQDLADQAALLGLPIAYHPAYPLRPARALRAALHAADHGKAEAFVPRVMAGYWAEGADITDPALLAAWGAEVGLGGVVEAAFDPARKAELEANLEQALAAGLFGLPAAVLDGKIYFGNDRLELLEHHLLQAETGAAGPPRDL